MQDPVIWGQEKNSNSSSTLKWVEMPLSYRYMASFQGTQSLLHRGLCRSDHSIPLWTDPSRPGFTRSCPETRWWCPLLPFSFSDNLSTSWFTEDGRFAGTWLRFPYWLTQPAGQNTFIARATWASWKQTLPTVPSSKCVCRKEVGVHYYFKKF